MPPRVSQDPCPRCAAPLQTMDHCFDRDGIRHGERCTGCRTVFKNFAHGRVEASDGDYRDLGDQTPPDHMVEARAQAFHRQAVAAGYVRRADWHPHMVLVGAEDGQTDYALLSAPTKRTAAELKAALGRAIRAWVATDPRARTKLAREGVLGWDAILRSQSAPAREALAAEGLTLEPCVATVRVEDDAPPIHADDLAPLPAVPAAPPVKPRRRR